MSEFASMKVVELRALLKKKKMDTSGRKVALIARLEEDAKAAAARLEEEAKAAAAKTAASRSRSRSRSRSSSRSRSRSSSDDFDAIYGGKQPRDEDSPKRNGDVSGDEEEEEYYFSTVGRKVFVRGLPFSWDKKAIRAKFGTVGNILSVAITKNRRGTATIEYEKPIEASKALIDFDGQAAGHRKLLVSAAQQFFKPPPVEVESSEEEDDFNTNSMFCPISFSGRGTKTVEKKARHTVNKWRSIFCKLCGLRGHTTEGCPLGLKTYHKRIVMGEVKGGLLGVKMELGLIKKPKVEPKTEPKGVGPSDTPKVIAPRGRGADAQKPAWMTRSKTAVPRGRGAAGTKPAWMTKSAEASGGDAKANASAIQEVSKAHDAQLEKRQKKQALATKKMEGVLKKDLEEQLRPTKRKSSAVKLEYAGAETSEVDPEVQRKEWEQQVLQYYKNFSAPQQFCYGMDNGIFLRYTTAYIVELPPGIKDPNEKKKDEKKDKKKDKKKDEKKDEKEDKTDTKKAEDEKSYKTPMGRMVPNRLHLCRLLPSSNRVLAIDVTPKREPTDTGGKKKRKRKKKGAANPQPESDPKELCPVEDLSATMQEVQKQTPDAAKNSILQVAARAQPFTAHLDFDLSNDDADNLQQVTTGKAMQLLKAFVEESVREELSSGTWTAVWVKDACRYYYSNKTSGVLLWDLDQAKAKEPKAEAETSASDKDKRKADDRGSSRSDRSRSRRDRDRDRDRDRGRDRDRDRDRGRSRSRDRDRRRRHRSPERKRQDRGRDRSRRQDSRKLEPRRRGSAPAPRSTGPTRVGGPGGRGGGPTRVGGPGGRGGAGVAGYRGGGSGKVNTLGGSQSQKFGSQQVNTTGGPQSQNFGSQRVNTMGGYQSQNFGSQRVNTFGGPQSQNFGSQRVNTMGGSQNFGSQRGSSGASGYQQPRNTFGGPQSQNFGSQRVNTFGGSQSQNFGSQRGSTGASGYQQNFSSQRGSTGASGYQKSPSAGRLQQRPGDWICQSCGNLNFARRTECNRCGAPRPKGGIATAAPQNNLSGNPSGGYSGGNASMGYAGGGSNYQQPQQTAQYDHGGGYQQSQQSQQPSAQYTQSGGQWGNQQVGTQNHGGYANSGGGGGWY